MSVYLQREGVSILGGTGFIGVHLVDHLLANQMGPIRVLTRSPDLIESRADVTLVEGDILSVDSVDNLVRAQKLVINLVYIDGDHEANLCAADHLVASCVRARVSRLIHFSTAVVVGRVDGSVVDETTSCYPCTEYERTKLAVEERLLEQSAGKLELIIIRPTAVFGRGGMNLVKLANSLLYQPRMLNLLSAMLFKYRRLHLVPVEDVVGAIIFLATLDKDLAGERFIVSRDEHTQNNYYDLANHLAQRFGQRAFPVSFIPFSLFITKVLLKLRGRSQINPQQVFYSGKLRDYGFTEQVGFIEAIDSFAEYFLRTSLNRAGS